MTLSDAVSSRYLTIERVFALRFRCESMTPFGSPVVPDGYIIVARSSVDRTPVLGTPEDLRHSSKETHPDSFSVSATGPAIIYLAWAGSSPNFMMSPRNFGLAITALGAQSAAIFAKEAAGVLWEMGAETPPDMSPPKSA